VPESHTAQLPINGKHNSVIKKTQAHFDAVLNLRDFVFND
jgi:hypothetical protein